jgi:hypothetical protein
MKPSVFHVKQSIEHFGVWYAIWHYKASNIWTIWVATRMIKRDSAAQREHAEWHYSRR